MSLDLDRAWLHRAVRHTRAAVDEISDTRASCLLSTKLLCAVLSAFEVSARPQAVWVTARNAAAMEAMLAGRDERTAPGAWSVGVRPGAVVNAGAWPGHLVTVVRAPNVMRQGGPARLLVDLSADQFDRPEHGIVFGGPVIFGIDGTWSPQDPLASINHDARCAIQYVPSVPGQDAHASWRDTPAFTTQATTLDALAAQVAAVLR